MGARAVAALYPLLVGFNVIPKIILVPIVALMFVGQHDLNTIQLAFMGILVYYVVATLQRILAAWAERSPD